MKAIDLFCGAGGLTLGLRRAGWDIIAGIDVDEAVGTTYEGNNPGATFVSADLRSVTDEEIQTLAGAVPAAELLLAGCAPCQPFSKQRRRGRYRKPGDATLLGQFARLVRALEPKVILMENVPGIAAVPGFSSFRRFLKTLRDCGYECDYGILNRTRLWRAAASSPLCTAGRPPDISGASVSDRSSRIGRYNGTVDH